MACTPQQIKHTRQNWQAPNFTSMDRARIHITYYVNFGACQSWRPSSIHILIEGLRPPKFRAVIFVFFVSVFKRSLFRALPASASQHSLTCIFYWVWQHLRPSLPESPLNYSMQPSDFSLPESLQQLDVFEYFNLSDRSGTQTALSPFWVSSWVDFFATHDCVLPCSHLRGRHI